MREIDYSQNYSWYYFCGIETAYNYACINATGAVPLRILRDTSEELQHGQPQIRHE